MINTNIKILVLFLSGVLLLQCTRDKNPIYHWGTIDPDLVGSWYNMETQVAYGNPPVSIKGIEILGDGSINTLAVEWSTGKIQVSSARPVARFMNAIEQKCSVKIFPQGMLPERIYESNYRIKNSRLYLGNQDQPGAFSWFNDFYEKTTPGEIVTQPIHSEFEVTMDDYHFRNSAFSSSPSAYFRYLSPENDTTISILAYENNQHLNIYLERFTGQGTYLLGSETNGRADYYTSGGCCIAIISTDQYPYAGSITINNFDLSNKRCSGTFNFTIDDQSFTNGRFDIPVYN
jgi:hypothetical protein